jgi:hypothetical protein
MIQCTSSVTIKHKWSYCMVEFGLGLKKIRSAICLFMTNVHSSLVLVKWKDATNKILKYLPELANISLSRFLHFPTGTVLPYPLLHPSSISSPSATRLRATSNRHPGHGLDGEWRLFRSMRGCDAIYPAPAPRGQSWPTT